MNVFLMWLFGVSVGLNSAFLIAGGFDIFYSILVIVGIAGSFVFWSLHAWEAAVKSR
jgi:hypothetical protein